MGEVERCVGRLYGLGFTSDVQNRLAIRGNRYRWQRIQQGTEAKEFLDLGVGDGHEIDRRILFSTRILCDYELTVSREEVQILIGRGEEWQADGRVARAVEPNDLHGVHLGIVVGQRVSAKR